MLPTLAGSSRKSVMLLFVLRYSLQSLCFALVNNAVILRLAIAISQDSCKTKMTGVSPGELNDMTTERSSNVRHAAIATWRFGKIAVEAARGSLSTHGTALDAVEKGINAVELDTEDQYFVGVGGLPNAEGVMELDAAIMDGNSMYFGAVMAIRGVMTPISAARLVLERSPHRILVGEGATKFALEHGMQAGEALTAGAREQWEDWKISTQSESARRESEQDRGDSHDTVGMICLDEHGSLAAGTSTSGWKFKYPGRVGDSPVVGSGLYCDSRAGGAVATGDGEEILRTSLSFLVVENMRAGDSPTLACEKGIKRLKEIVELPTPASIDESHRERMHRKLTVAVMAMSPSGEIGAASTLGPDNSHRGRPAFPFAIWRDGEDVRLVEEDSPTLNIRT